MKYTDEVEAEIKLCEQCGEEFTIYPDDTHESGACWGYPDICWSCAFDKVSSK